MNGRDLRLNDLHTLTRMKYIIPSQSQLESVLNQPNDNLSNLAKYNNLLRKENISSESGSNKLHSSLCPNTFVSKNIPYKIEKNNFKRRRLEEEEELPEEKKFKVSPQKKKLDLTIVKKEKDQSSSYRWENFG